MVSSASTSVGTSSTRVRSSPRKCSLIGLRSSAKRLCPRSRRRSESLRNPSLANPRQLSSTSPLPSPGEAEDQQLIGHLEADLWEQSLRSQRNFERTLSLSEGLRTDVLRTSAVVILKVRTNVLEIA